VINENMPHGGSAAECTAYCPSRSRHDANSFKYNNILNQYIGAQTLEHCVKV